MKQINKVQARKLYEADKPFIIVPANMRPDSQFAVHMKPGWMWRILTISTMNSATTIVTMKLGATRVST